MYDQKAGDSAFLGVTTFVSAHGKAQYVTRYFVPITVLGNDRDAGRLFVEDRGRVDWLVWSPDEGGFSGDEIVSSDRNDDLVRKGFALPRNTAEAGEMERAGTHPDSLCDYCSAPALWHADATAEYGPARRCTACSFDLSRDVTLMR